MTRLASFQAPGPVPHAGGPRHPSVPSHPPRGAAPRSYADYRAQLASAGELAPRPIPRPAPPRVAAELERRIIEVLASDLDPSETIEHGFRRKELALGALFASLTVAEARAVHRQLMIGADDDQLALWFARLVAERRVRLLAFLADAPRRAAQRGGCRPASGGRR